MDYKINIKDFSLEQTITCGQCFHFTKLDYNDFVLVHLDKMLHVSQEEDVLILYNSTEEDYNLIWKHYFDLDNDYAGIKDKLISMDDKLPEVIAEGEGIHLMNQDFFETLISFILSQNNQIPRIKQLVDRISRTYGKYVGEIKGIKCYRFPTPEELSKATEDELRLIKVGFRASYIMDAVKKVISGDISYENLIRSSYEDKKNALMSVKGIGEKVANCIILYSLNEREAFPIDVWIKRIMENIYFDSIDTKKEIIAEYAKKHYKDLGGYAQQYLFYYGRNIKKMK